MLQRGPPAIRRAGLALVGTTVVVVGQMVAVAVSLSLTPATQSRGMSVLLAWVPLLAYTGALLWVTFVFQRESMPRNSRVGSLLLAAVPFTAFGGGCHTEAAVSTGVGLFRSGVRLGVDTGACLAYLNWVVMVLGAGLLTVGLWVQLGDAV